MITYWIISGPQIMLIPIILMIGFGAFLKHKNKRIKRIANIGFTTVVVIVGLFMLLLMVVLTFGS